jgi:hypothetical protein
MLHPTQQWPKLESALRSRILHLWPEARALEN